MKDKVKKALDDFVNPPETKEELVEKAKKENTKKVIIDEKDGLIIERVDKIFVTSDGRMLLREVY